jgi:hypothetical protein
LLFYCAQSAYCQQAAFDVVKISLPSEIAYYDNQFSGMYIHKGNLYLMSESRLQDNREAKLYAIKLTDINRKLVDTSLALPFVKYPIKNLDVLRTKMDRLGDEYEGLEAIIIEEDEVYLSVETSTPCDNCYLLRGRINDSTVVLDPNLLLPLPKPITIDGSHIYNAGFEAIAINDKSILNFFEYNLFDYNNAIISITPASYTDVYYQKPTIEKIPFRITDITKTGKNSFTAINYFYKGGGDDAVYRVPKTDANDNLIRDTSGYKSYCRLIKINYKNYKYSWKPYWEFPAEYMSYNWECLAAYKDGYFVMNDKYTPAKPYSTILLYLQPKP